jgi:hypothetical protein
MNPEAPPPTADVLQLTKEVADLRGVLRVILGVVFAGISYLSFTALLAVPRFEKIFEDMLGDNRMLPEITKLVIGWGRLAPMSHALLLGVIVTGFILLATTRSIRTAGMAFALCSGPLLLHILICWTGTVLPLLQVLKGLSAGS